MPANYVTGEYATCRFCRARIEQYAHNDNDWFDHSLSDDRNYPDGYFQCKGVEATDMDQRHKPWHPLLEAAQAFIDREEVTT